MQNMQESLMIDTENGRIFILEVFEE